MQHLSLFCVEFLCTHRLPNALLWHVKLPLKRCMSRHHFTQHLLHQYCYSVLQGHQLPCLAFLGGYAQLPQEQLLQLIQVFSYVEQQSSKKAVRISDVGSVVWQKVQVKAHLAVSPYSGTFVVTDVAQPDRFDWDDRIEKAQADRYMPYLNNNLPVNKREY